MADDRVRIRKKFDLVVFDMAGTTVQDHGEVPDAFTTALNKFAVNISPEELATVRGASKREALAMLLPDSKLDCLDAIYTDFIEALKHSYHNKAAAIPGAVDVFRYFQEAGVCVALNTGFDRDIVHPLLAKLGWDQKMFAAIVCGDEVTKGRPAPDLILKAAMLSSVCDTARVVNVGDTMLDMEAGARAKVGVNCAVLSGAHSRDQLMASPSSMIAESVRELPGLIAEFC